MSTENEKNPIVNGKELKNEAVEQVTGGLFAFNPDESLASFTMTHQFTAAAAPAVDASVAAVANAATAVAFDERPKPDSVSNGECLVTFTRL